MAKNKSTETDEPRTYEIFKIKSKSLHKEKDQWLLNVPVTEDVSPTNWVDITLPSGKLKSDPTKSNWYSKEVESEDDVPRSGNKGNEKGEKTLKIHIANEVGELHGITKGAGGGQEISITPHDLRDSIIRQGVIYASSKAADNKAKDNTREIPEVAGAENETEAQADL